MRDDEIRLSQESVEYQTKSLLRRFGYDRIVKREDGQLKAKGFEDGRTITADLPAEIFPEMELGETLDLRRPADFRRCFLPNDPKEAEKQDRNVVAAIEAMKEGETGERRVFLGQWCMGRLMACVTAERDQDGRRLVADFSMKRHCSKCKRLLDAERENSYLRQKAREIASCTFRNGIPYGQSCSISIGGGAREETVSLYRGSEKRMVLDLDEVPADDSLFPFLKSQLDAFLPELEPELYDESQEEFSP